MKRLKLAAAALSMAIIGGCAVPNECNTSSAEEVFTVSEAAQTQQSEPLISYSELLQCRYHDERDFRTYHERSEVYPYSGEIISGVVPHHLTAGYMISGFFKTAAESRQDIETVVILAPLHYSSDKMLITSDKGWAAPYGTVSCDNEASEVFVDRLGAQKDDEMLQYDHSASSHIPFVKYYLPDAEVACLLVSPKADKDTPQRIADALFELSQQKECLFLFSIDFSHYLTPDEADKNDADTLAAVMAGDTDLIERMKNDNVDSPYFLSAYVRLSQAFGGTLTAADNSNTCKLLELPFNSNSFPDGVTSYFVYLTSKQLSQTTAN